MLAFYTPGGKQGYTLKSVVYHSDLIKPFAIAPPTLSRHKDHAHETGNRLNQDYLRLHSAVLALLHDTTPPYRLSCVGKLFPGWGSGVNVQYTMLRHRDTVMDAVGPYLRGVFDTVTTHKHRGTLLLANATESEVADVDRHIARFLAHLTLSYVWEEVPLNTSLGVMAYFVS